MANGKLSRSELTAAGRKHALGVYRSHRVRVALLVLVVLIVLFGLFGFFAAPTLIKNQLQEKIGAQLDRPVTIGAIHLNPFTLKLDIDALHIADRDRTSPFVDIDHLMINASWASVFRLAPVLDALDVEHPQFRVTRLSANRFNFSDITDKFAAKPSDPKASPTHFALSNITVHGGDFTLDDKTQNATHRVDHFELGIPFIANLPHDTDIFVQPLLAMQVDGSPLRIQGQTKPFADTLESVVNFNLDHLDLARYLAYVPTPLPVSIPRGLLSGQLQIQFIETKPAQQLHVNGQLSVDHFAMTTRDAKPMFELEHGTMTLTDVQPLLSRYSFGAIVLDQAKLHYSSDAPGHSNFDALIGPSAKPAKPDAPKTDAHVATLTLQNSFFEYIDTSSAGPMHAVLANLHGTMTGIATLGKQPARLSMQADLASGKVGLDGQLALAADQFTGQLSMDGASLAPLVAMGPPMLNAEISKGTLNINGKLFADWGHTPTILRVDGTKIDVDDFALTQKGHTDVAWQSLNVAIAHADLSTSEAQLDAVALQGMKLNVQRLRDGKFDLANVSKPATAHKGAKKASAPPWRWSIKHVGIAGSNVDYKDLNVPGKGGHIAIDADKFAIDNVSDDMHKPIKLDLSGGIGKGKFHVDGVVKPEPAEADLHIQATRLNVAPLESLVSVPLNVNIESALLSARGHARYRDHTPQALVSYQGQITLGHVQVLDKITGDDFLSWNALSATGMSVRAGEGAPQVTIGALALDNFYARVIVNSNGRLNIQDVVAKPETAPVSVTQANNGNGTQKLATPSSAGSAPASPNAGTLLASSTSSPSSASTAPTPPPAIEIGGITLSNGHLNYTDNFIKPNYTANITQLAGKVGAFGTKAGGPPADLSMQGQIDDDAPVNIDGTVNPLAPVAFLDIKAKADGVELTHLSPYSSKYTGYPITKGRLTMDVHYGLDQGKLDADNHIFLTQLTFGDRVNGPGIGHLPVKLAVALLKDSNGDIDVDVPVTGSLSDPHFSLGSVIWHAFVNLITRAVTAPFRLLGGGSGGGHQDLGYVEFAPGSTVLDAQAQAKLTEIVKILNQKTALKLDIIGRVDPKFDEDGLRKVTMEDNILRELNNDRDGQATEADVAKLSPDDYNRYLGKAYKHAKFAKPRDIVGLTKSQPPDVMQKLIQTNVPVDADAYRHLAERRADAVRQWLRGKIPDDRVFVLAPKLDTKGIDDKGKTTRVDFGLH